MPSTTVKKTTTSPAKAPVKKPVTKAPVTKAPATKTSPVTKTAGKTAPARKSPTSTKGAKKSDVTKKVATPAAKPVKEAEAQVKETPKVEAKRKIIHHKQIAKILIEDDDNDIRSHGKAVLVVDNENNIAARFLPYSGANVLEASDPSHMQAERIRLGIMGAVRFGKPIALDFGECGPDMLEALERKFDEVQKGLLAKCMNRDICKREVYESLLKESDEESYRVASYYDFELDISAKFIFMIIMKSTVYPPSFTEQFYTVTIEQQ